MDETKTGPTGYYDDRIIAENYDKRTTTKDALERARIMGVLLKQFTSITRESLCLRVIIATRRERYIHGLTCWLIRK